MWPHIILDKKLLDISHTQAREEVFLALRLLQPCTQIQLIKSLKDRVGRRTVQRTTNIFIARGIAFRPEGKLIYLAPEFIQHRHVIQCVKCGRETPYRDDRIERHINRIATAGGFRPIGHNLAIVGTCGPNLPCGQFHG